MASLGTAPAETVMVGDDVEADVNGAVAASLNGMLVRTGKFRPGDDRRMISGGRCTDDVAAAVESVLGG